MTIQQIPSSPPLDPNLMFSNGDAPAVIVMIVLAALVATTIILWPIMRALGRRLEHRGDPDPAVRAEIEQMHQRLTDLDAIRVRVAELEERLDFTERLLAQAREPDRLRSIGGPKRELCRGDCLCRAGVPAREGFGPIGAAIGARIRPTRHAVDMETLAEVDALRMRLAEVEERLDFAERLLSRTEAMDQLPGSTQQ